MIDTGRPEKGLREFNMRSFLILNPYKFLPLSALIKLEINYSNKLENRCSQEVSIMVLKDKFTIQEINLDKKDLSYYKKLKKIEVYWNHEFAKHSRNNHRKIFDA